MKFRSVTAMVVGVGLVAGAQGALLDLDFQTNGDDGFGNGDNITAPGFTPFIVEDVDGSGPGGISSVSTDPSVTVNGITFAIQGEVAGWPGNDPAASNADPLRSDYLILGLDILGLTPTLNWSLSGLAANTAYNLTWTSGHNGNRVAEVSSGGDSVLVASNDPLIAPEATLVVTTDANGVVTGSFTGVGDVDGEGNIAALSVANVPEPGSLAILGLGGLLLVRRSNSC